MITNEVTFTRRREDNCKNVVWTSKQNTNHLWSLNMTYFPTYFLQWLYYCFPLLSSLKAAQVCPLFTVLYTFFFHVSKFKVMDIIVWLNMSSFSTGEKQRQKNLIHAGSISQLHVRISEKWTTSKWYVCTHISTFLLI